MTFASSKVLIERVWNDVSVTAVGVRVSKDGLGSGSTFVISIETGPHLSNP